ncbi:protein-methionine-sulfoxide reductase catalytic subunit MsrP [Methylocella sp.]|uniref:protein-methionine-sulfoxide reductase catalytic subunit MsrP n=1 Tax=Methylocella sp. TaxID=1978226 RepID=UPI003784B44E
MFYHRRKGWEIDEREATPKALFLSRRAALATGLGAAAALAAPPAMAFWFGGDTPKPEPAAPDPTRDLYPARRNEAYRLDRPVTPQEINAHYNNFYEFGMTKDVSVPVQALRTRPWTLRVDGLVEAPREIGIDDLIRAGALEERLYRHRCVEAWSMAVPWTGFPLKRLVDMAKPLSSAKYVVFETFLDRSIAPGQAAPFYPWPYREGLTMAEAANDLAFLVTGAYGEPLARQHGAPLRLATPWKYGFKSIKSIRRISFASERPKTFWEGLQPAEYGFWANVNPAVPHPRWSQATEEVLGTGERRKTLLFNGYGEFVADLYAGLPNDRLYM